MKDIGKKLLRNYTLFFNVIYNGSSNILHHTKFSIYVRVQKFAIITIWNKGKTNQTNE